MSVLVTIFLTILRMSLVSIPVLLIIILIRQLIKSLPKVYTYALWSVLLFRLLCPFSFESPFAILPSQSELMTSVSISSSRETNLSSDSISIKSNSTIGSNGIDSSATEKGSTYESSSSNTTGLDNDTNSTPWYGLKSFVQLFRESENLLTLIWLLGVGLFILYNVISLYQLNNRLRNASHLKENIYISSAIKTPFVFGLFKARIFVPENLDQASLDYILLHEQVHIRRGDYILKLLAYIAFIAHWFNPFVWIAFSLYDKDMEMACDEAVLKEKEISFKLGYASTLLAMSSKTRKHKINIMSISFGEHHSKSRIKHILAYKKPSIILSFVGLILLIFIIGFLSINRVPKEFLSFSLQSQDYKVSDIVFESPIYSFTYFMETAPSYCISSDLILYDKDVNASSWSLIGPLTKTLLTGEDIRNRLVYDMMADSDFLEQLNHMTDIYQVNIFDQPLSAIQVNVLESMSSDGSAKVLSDTDSTNYFLMVDDSNQVYLAIGYTKDGSSWLRWVFSLESQGPLTHEISLIEEAEIEEKASPQNEMPIDINALIENDDENFEKAIKQAIKTTHDSDYDEGFEAISYVPFLTEVNEENQEVKIYMMTLYLEMEEYNGQIRDISGSHGPETYTFHVDDQGNYEMTNFWIPDSGDEYGPSIEKEFPEELWSFAIDTQRNVTPQMQNCYSQYIETMNFDIDDAISLLIDEIMSSPLESSTPKDYVDSHELEVRQLTYYGDYSLIYLDKHLGEDNDESGLRRALMESLRDIVEDSL